MFKDLPSGETHCDLVADAKQRALDKTKVGKAKSKLIGDNVEKLVDNGVSFWVALEATLKVYDHS